MNCDFQQIDGDWKCFRCGYVPKRKRAHPPAGSSCPAPTASMRPAPGAELKRLLDWFSIQDTASCRCRERAAQMDREGCDWCEQNISLIASWLQEEAWARGIPMVAIAFYPVIRQAITNARARQS